MKKILVILVCLLALPLSVNAIAYSESFVPGERVKVYINATDSTEFFVIKNSEAGATHVWLLSEKALGQTEYDAIIPGEHETLTGEWSNTVIKSFLDQKTSTWTYAETIRLLDETDFADLGIAKTNNIYEIKPSHKYLAPIKFENAQLSDCPECGYNFWTQIIETDGDDIYAGIVTYNESYNGSQTDNFATVEMTKLDEINGPKMTVRPVIYIDKDHIDCRVEVTTTTTTTQINPPTSEVNFPSSLIGVVALSGIIFVIVRKKEIFTKI